MIIRRGRAGAPKHSVGETLTRNIHSNFFHGSSVRGHNNLPLHRNCRQRMQTKIYLRGLLSRLYLNGSRALGSIGCRIELIAVEIMLRRLAGNCFRLGFYGEAILAADCNDVLPSYQTAQTIAASTVCHADRSRNQPALPALELRPQDADLDARKGVAILIEHYAADRAD